MGETIRKIAAGGAIVLGIAHLIYGIFVFKTLTPDHIWFAGAGVAMICVGLANYKKPALLQAGIISVYFALMAVIMPLPQILLGLVIFVTLTVSSFLKHKE